MSKNSVIERKLRRIKLYKLKNEERKAIRRIRNSKKISIMKRFETQIKLSRMPRNSSRIRIRNRCELTGRGRGVYRKFNLSRICIRRMASECKLPGVTKSSW
jgi:small subunit ribosomal protein S14